MMVLCCCYRNIFSYYFYFYVEDRKEIFGQFLLYGYVFIFEEIEVYVEDGILENFFCFYQFKVQIDFYEKLYEEVCRLEFVKVFDNWMKIDVRFFKVFLLNIIKKWSFMFKQYFVDYVINR